MGGMINTEGLWESGMETHYRTSISKYTQTYTGRD